MAFFERGSKYSTFVHPVRSLRRINAGPPGPGVPRGTPSANLAIGGGAGAFPAQYPGRKPQAVQPPLTCFAVGPGGAGILSSALRCTDHESWGDPMTGVRYELTVVLFSGTPKSQQWTIDAPQVDQIRAELGRERPKWVLSTYGAVKNTPGSLFEGNEYSPEEIRLRFYEMAAKGQDAQADQEASQLWSKAESDMNNALDHVGDIRKFMEDCEKKHPNRYDFLSFDGTKTREDHGKAVEASHTAAASSGFGAGTGFGQPSTAASNPFSKPAAATFGQPTGPSAFGGNAFGKPAQPSGFGQTGFGASTAATAFGQPAEASAFGKPAFGASGFGQTAQPAQQAPAFGQAAQTPGFGASGFGSSAPAFGKPAQPTSAFGQPATTTPAFGQPAQSNAVFGKSAFGQAGFGQSAFGQPSQPGGFGQSGFGQAAQPSTTSAFGAPGGTGSPFGVNVGGGGFGQQAQSTIPAAPEVSMDSETPTSNQPPQAAQPVSVNPFGSTSAPSNPFGMQTTNPQAQPSSSNLATASVVGTNTSQDPHPLTGKPSAPLVYTQTLPAGPTQANMAKQLSTYRGQPVRYLKDTSNVNAEGTTIPCYNRPDGKGGERIWFPEGAAGAEISLLNREEKMWDIQAPAEKYTDDVRNVYKTLFETGKFEPGKMPHVPPMREWIAYDF